MTLARFIESLFTEGRVRVANTVDRSGTLMRHSSDELEEVASVLTDLELQYRNQLPGTPPNVSQPALVWGAVLAYRVCSFLAHREASAEIVHASFAETYPLRPSPENCYSFDLTLRFLPDMMRLAKAISANDPLVKILQELGRRWPLSSVGIAEIDPLDVAPILDHPCLKQLYVDRVIATKDRSRFNDPQVAEAVRAAIGLHSELAPDLAAYKHEASS